MSVRRTVAITGGVGNIAGRQLYERRMVVVNRQPQLAHLAAELNIEGAGQLWVEGSGDSGSDIDITVSGGRLAYMAGEAGARFLSTLSGLRLAAE